ncbi:MAG TPA: TonB-dependent receptor [Cyclobacteriaceae bacterium]|nr:TonB-dependent receptor [Cyclobacteriaceae bacterium]
MRRTFTHTLFTITLVLVSAATFAQVQKEGNGKITGTVLDAQSGEPVEFATVAVKDPATGKPIDGTVCDDKGKFSVTKVPNGTFKVEISFIGYETYSQDVAISDRRATVDMGTLKIGASVTQLNEVVVEGQRSLVEEKVDRMIYNAENDNTTRGGDASDVLRRVPMLSVDMDGNVSLRGNQNIRVLINNKPSTITASSVADALKQIPADQIKSVEVITSPSAKYDAEGSAGIINIITKKNTMQGFTLNVDGNAGLRGSNLGLNSNFRTGKMGFSLGGFGRSNYNVTGTFSNAQTTRNFDTSGNLVSQTLNTQEASTLNRGLFGNYNFGWDYDINKKNSLVASVRLGARNGRNFQDGLATQTFTNGSLVNNTLTDVTTKDLSNNVDANLTYTRLFDQQGKEFSLMTSLSRNNRTNNFVRSALDVNDESTILSRTKNDNDSYNQEATIQADYTTPLGKKQIVEVGGKNISRIVSSNYQYFNAVGADGDYVLNTDASRSNKLDYTQNVTAGYLSYTATLPKGYSLKAGGRYEYTTIHANLKDEQEIHIPSYGVLVPSANLSKKLKNGTLKIAYNRRIQRPSIQYLNPNIQAGNTVNITEGNPTLQPEYTNNYELSYSTFMKGASFNLSTFVRNTNNAIQNVRDIATFDGRQVIRTTYQNIGKEDAYGASAFTNITISEKLSINGGSDFYYAVLNNNNPDPAYSASNEGWVVSGRMFGSYNFTKTWGLQFFGFYRGRQVQLQGNQGGFGIYSLSVKKDFANKKGSVGFGAENFFNVNGFKIRNEQESLVLTQKSVNVMNNLSFKVNFSFRFGKMSYDQQPRRGRRSINNDDLKDGGGGDGGGGMDNGGGGGGFSGGGNMGGGNRGGGQRGNAAPATTNNNAASNTNAPKADPKAVVDPVGTWAYTVESPQGGGGTIVIRKEGDVLTGTLTNNRFNRENQLKSVTMNGNEITFGYENSFNGNTNVVTVKATIEGNDMKGMMSVGQFGSFPINAKRN